MKAIKTQIDYDFEDEGLFSITMWVSETPPRYISISRDVEECPDELYFEAEDQIYGFKTRSMSYAINDNILTLNLSKDGLHKFHWTSENNIVIDLEKGSTEEVKVVLKKIFDIN